MALFLDSANIEDARRAQELGFIEGITTNPALIAQNGQDGIAVLTELVEIFDGHVFYQVTAAALEARIDEAWQAYEVRPDRVVIEIPISAENLMMISKLSGVDIAITEIVSPAQAYLAAMAKALYVIPKFKTAVGNASNLVQEIVEVLDGTESQVLAGGITSTDDAMAILKAGTHHLTLPLHLIEAIANFTDR